MAAHVFDHGSGIFFLLVFAGIDVPRVVFPKFALSQNGEVCTVDASSAEQFFLENLDIIPVSTLYFAVFSAVRRLR